MGPSLVSVITLLHTGIVCVVNGLDNGLAKTPPMGWLSWTRFMCRTDCRKYPKDCISEDLFLQMADIMVRDGYLAAGYNQVNIDDCWSMRDRDKQTKRLVPDPIRFRHGIKWLVGQLHDRAFKAGIYANYGKHTCMGFAGTTAEDFKVDAETFAEWDVDMLKFDGCFNDPRTLDDAYPAMGRQLNKTGRPMVYSCSWPYYTRTEAKLHPNYEAIARYCNLWRNFDDIAISFKSIESIIDFYNKNSIELARYHGPGHWNDPDMIIIGNPGISVDQAKVQMALWCIWSAPLLMSNDLRDMEPGHREILINRDLIAINQDPLGEMGRLIDTKNDVNIYLKRIMPEVTVILEVTSQLFHSYAIALYNTRSARKASILISLASLGIPKTHKVRYRGKELFSGQDIGILQSHSILNVTIEPTSALMYRLIVQSDDDARGPRDRIQKKSPGLQPEPHDVGLNWQALLVISMIIACLYLLFRRKCRPLVAIRSRAAYFI